MTDTPTIGDNFPPEPTPFERWAELVDNCNTWSKNVPKIASAEQAGRAQAFVDQLRLTTEDVEGAWKKEREPYDLAIAALRTKYRAPLELLGIALEKMKALAKDWLDREKARLAREAEERHRLAIEAAQKADAAITAAATEGTVEAEAEARRLTEQARTAIKAADKPVERPQIRGEFSPRAMSMRVTWFAVIDDEQKALKHFAKHPAIRAAALAAIVKLESDHARKVKDASKAAPGVRYDKKETAA